VGCRAILPNVEELSAVSLAFKWVRHARSIDLGEASTEMISHTRLNNKEARHTLSKPDKLSVAIVWAEIRRRNRPNFLRGRNIFCSITKYWSWYDT